MRQQKLPAGWDEARVKRLIAHYEQMDEDELLAEDESAQDTDGRTLMVVPTDLVPEVRALMARNQGA